MVQHTVESKTNEYGLGTSEAELSIHDKQLSVPVKKTVLRDLQNDNRIAVPNSVGSSSASKDKIPSNAPRVSGTKRPLSDCRMTPSEQQHRSTSAANRQLVYVRRKSEADIVRNSTIDNGCTNAECQVSRKMSNQESSSGPISQLKEPKVHSVDDNASISADRAVSSVLSHQEAGTGPIPQSKEAKVRCANDTVSINTDSVVSRIITHQEAGAGPIPLTKEPEVRSASDNASINTDSAVSIIITHQEAGTGSIPQTKDPEVHFASASINTDSAVSRTITNQEAGKGPIPQTKNPEVHFANDIASINAECQLSRKCSHAEASTGPLSQTKETKAHCANDDAADCEVSRICSHQEAEAGVISQSNEPEVHFAKDNKSVNADHEVLRITSHQEEGSRSIFQTKEPKVHFAADNARLKVESSVQRTLSHQDASTGPISQSKEPTIHCIPAFAPFPKDAAAISPPKPSVSVPHCKPYIRVASAGSNCQTPASVPSLGNSKGFRNLHWEERFHQLQLLLRKLDQSDHEDYLKMLRSLSSVELSRHAVELEKRSIQLSLEEAKELKRVGVLNVLGKPTKPFKVPSTLQDRSEK